MSRAALSMLLTALCAALTSCASDPRTGYAFAPSHEASLGPVAVELFDNQTFAHGLEVELTRAIAQELTRSTPWAVAPPAKARTILSGAITSLRLRLLSTAPTSGLPQEQAVEVAVDFSLRDARTGKVILSRRNFRAAGSFIPVQGVGERIETAHAGAVDALAQDIVAALRSDW